MAAQCVAGCAKHRLSSEARGAVRSEAAACERRRSAPPGARSTDCRAKREAPSEAKRRRAKGGAVRRRVREAPIVERSERRRPKRSGGVRKAAQCAAGCAKHRLSSEARGAVRSEAAAGAEIKRGPSTSRGL